MNVLTNAFETFLETGTSRSTAKLKPLHGAIAQDLALRLGDSYTIQAQGYENDKEGLMIGRYYDKRVDITVFKKGRPVAGIAVKFVMQNYSQNSNNYFENMLGETANIRAQRCPYFQVFIVFDKLPYYDRNKNIRRWEGFTSHNAGKYIRLSEDNTRTSFHTPDKTLLYVIHIPDNLTLTTEQDYMDYYLHSTAKVTLSSAFEQDFDDAVILNDYTLFIDKVYHTIKSK